MSCNGAKKGKKTRMPLKQICNADKKKQLFKTMFRVKGTRDWLMLTVMTNEKEKCCVHRFDLMEPAL